MALKQITKKKKRPLFVVQELKQEGRALFCMSGSSDFFAAVIRSTGVDFGVTNNVYQAGKFMNNED